MKIRYLVLFSFIFLMSSINAVEVTNVKFTASPDQDYTIDIAYQGRVISPPHFAAYGDTVAIKWPSATSQTPIADENITLKQENGSLWFILKNQKVSPADIFRLSLKLAGDSAKAQIPREILSKVKAVNLTAASTAPVVAAIAPVVRTSEVKKLKVEPVKKDEDYLSYLLSSVDKENKKSPPIDFAKDLAPAKEMAKPKVETKTVKLDLGVNKNIKETSSNLGAYALRIALVLCFVIGVIFLLAKVSKKIMIGKNKLGFLHNSKVVEILNTTYVGPKRQLLLVKVYDQVLLLSNAENGLNFISEVKDLSNILKMAEQEVTGNNFDSRMDQNPVSQVVLKDEKKIFESKPIEDNNSKMRSVLKNKVKSLKAWQ